MIINNCFKVRRLLLTAALIGGLSLVNHANAQQVASYLIDLNSGTVTDLGETYPPAINDAGQVVGSYYPIANALPHAFITGPNGMGMRDLGAIDGLQ